MVNDQHQALPENARSLRTTGRIIQFALMASTLIYGLVANVMSMEGEPDISDPDGMQIITQSNLSCHLYKKLAS